MAGSKRKVGEKTKKCAADRERQKRYKETIDEAADEFVCPITTDLPVEPVTAEDGRTYERSAIEEHIRRNRLDLRSPVTNERMGPRLYPAVQVRNLLDKLVRSGAIAGDKADRWRKHIEEEEVVAKARDKAKSGDSSSMTGLGLWYYRGEMGLEKDIGLAYTWWRKAASTGNEMNAMCYVANMLIYGCGVEKNEVEGMALLAAAAQGGSALAAFFFGKHYFKGDCGLRQDWIMAKLWIEKAIADSSALGEENVRRANNFLDQMREHQES